MNYWDAHCHLSDLRLDTAWPAMIQRAQAAGISTFLLGGVSPEEWQRQSLLPDCCLPVFGLHPWTVIEQDEETLETAFNLLMSEVSWVRAIGETGCDFHPRFPKSSHSRQITWLERHLDLAQKVHKPIVLHVVRAHSPVLETLKHHPVERAGLIHSFFGSFETAQQYHQLGFLISIGPALLDSRSEKLRQAVSRMPLDWIVVESDAPDQKPRSETTEWNEPTVVLKIAIAIAEIKGCPAEHVLSGSAARLRQLLGELT
ncbi:MAG: TatD family hydrolase [Acidobacteria bacterium]|nr:TatD family hydrolase [Acidobacteriota bacterium]MCB9397558.1 TatD family hydrolase [Acidobacteriota bacterium]